jgi:hypothetical protein
LLLLPPPLQCCFTCRCRCEVLSALSQADMAKKLAALTQHTIRTLC